MKSCVLYDHFKVIIGNLVQVAGQAADLNPTEHLWEILEWHVRKCSPPPSSLICINGNYHISSFEHNDTQWCYSGGLLRPNTFLCLLGKYTIRIFLLVFHQTHFPFCHMKAPFVWPSAPNFPIGLTKDTPAYTHASGMHTSTLSCLPGDIH